MSEQIGTIVVEAGRYDDRNYACAAWNQIVECERQEVPVTLTRSHEGRPYGLHWGAKGIIVEANFHSYFCGNRISNRNPGDDRIGQEATYTFSCYAYGVNELVGLKLSPEYAWLADPSTWNREVADRALRLAIQRGDGWSHVERRISGEFLRRHGSPELVAAIGS